MIDGGMVAGGGGSFADVAAAMAGVQHAVGAISQVAGVLLVVVGGGFAIVSGRPAMAIPHALAGFLIFNASALLSFSEPAPRPEAAASVRAAPAAQEAPARLDGAGGGLPWGWLLLPLLPAAALAGAALVRSGARRRSVGGRPAERPDNAPATEEAGCEKAAERARRGAGRLASAARTVAAGHPDVAASLSRMAESAGELAGVLERNPEAERRAWGFLDHRIGSSVKIAEGFADLSATDGRSAKEEGDLAKAAGLIHELPAAFEDALREARAGAFEELSDAVDSMRAVSRLEDRIA